MANVITLPGIVSQGIETSLSYVIESDVEARGMGMPISIAYCREIINEYLKSLPPGTPDTTIIAGTFGKESILHILSQQNCEGLRWVKCKVNLRGSEYESVVLFGVDEDNKPLPKKYITPSHPMVRLASNHLDTDPVIYEVSGGVDIAQVKRDLGIPADQPIGAKDTDTEKAFLTVLNLP
jgi:hypothetical protein